MQGERNRMKPLVIIASGPSITRADVSLVEASGHDLLGINNAYQITDKLKIHYGCDTKWWRAHWDYLYPGPSRYSLKAEDNDEGVEGVTQMGKGERQGLSEEWPVLCWGGNSGYQAINLAYLLGYKYMVLLGYDMKVNGKSAHWHKDHNFPMCANPVSGTFPRWISDFGHLAKELKNRGVSIINASRDTNLFCFPCVTLEEICL